MSRSVLWPHDLLHVPAPGEDHNENEVQIKNYAPHGPEGQWRVGRLRDVQCRPPTLKPPILELGSSEQGKYEEEKGKEKSKDGGSALAIYSCRRAPGGLRVPALLPGRFVAGTPLFEMKGPSPPAVSLKGAGPVRENT